MAPAVPSAMNNVDPRGSKMRQTTGIFSNEKKRKTLTEIDHVGHRVDQAQYANCPAHHFVEIDVPVEGETPAEANFPQPRDALAQRQQQHKGAVKV